jgi:hypothetical protein
MRITNVGLGWICITAARALAYQMTIQIFKVNCLWNLKEEKISFLKKNSENKILIKK